MYRAYVQTLLIGFVAITAGCNQMAFEVDKTFNSCHNSGLNCFQLTDGVERFEYDVKVNSGMVDILFVDDNSGSMSPEQRHMADRFPTFISSLANLDYRIAIITTDVSASIVDGRANGPKPANGNGAFQDGKFLEFSPGVPVLTRDTPNKDQLFGSTIQRQETVQCEQNDFGWNYCPSSDERGIYAANLAVERNDSRFFRKNAHLAIVVLADEDERSTGGTSTGYPVEEKDRPENLIQKVKQTFGAQKSVSAHAIIVRPGDSDCLNKQVTTFPSGRTVRGFYGTFYDQLAKLTNGVVGSICSSDYGTELGNIGYSIQDHVNSVALACQPLESKVEVTLNPRPNGVTSSYDSATNSVKFSDTLPPNTSIHIVYDCKHL